MALLLVENDAPLEVSEGVADQIRARFSEGKGGWLMGSVAGEVEGDAGEGDADLGSQLMWIHPSHRVTILPGQRLAEDPDEGAGLVLMFV